MHFFCGSRVGVCGLGSPGQRLVPVAVGDLLVPVLSPLLLLLRALLLLSRHLLLPPTLSVATVWARSLTPDPTERLQSKCVLLLRSVRGREDGQAGTTRPGPYLSLLRSRRPCRGLSCPFISHRAEDHVSSICGDQPGGR